MSFRLIDFGGSEFIDMFPCVPHGPLSTPPYKQHEKYGISHMTDWISLKYVLDFIFIHEMPAIPKMPRIPDVREPSALLDIISILKVLGQPRSERWRICDITHDEFRDLCDTAHESKIRMMESLYEMVGKKINLEEGGMKSVAVCTIVHITDTMMSRYCKSQFPHALDDVHKVLSCFIVA